MNIPQDWEDVLMYYKGHAYLVPDWTATIESNWMGVMSAFNEDRTKRVIVGEYNENQP